MQLTIKKKTKKNISTTKKNNKKIKTNIVTRRMCSRSHMIKHKTYK